MKIKDIALTFCVITSIMGLFFMGWWMGRNIFFHQTIEYEPIANAVEYNYDGEYPFRNGTTWIDLDINNSVGNISWDITIPVKIIIISEMTTIFSKMVYEDGGVQASYLGRSMRLTVDTPTSSPNPMIWTISETIVVYGIQT